MSIFGCESSPDSPFLSGVEGVAGAEEFDGTLTAKVDGSGGGFFSDFAVWEIFREEYGWQPFARHFPGGFYGEQKFAVWMSGVKHNVKSRR